MSGEFTPGPQVVRPGTGELTNRLCRSPNALVPHPKPEMQNVDPLQVCRMALLP